MRGRGLPLSLVVVVALAFGCTRANKHYCPGRIDDDCSKDDASADVGDGSIDSDASDAGDVGDAADGGEAPEDVMEAPQEMPMCSNTSCSGDTPICDFDAGVCGACSTNDQCSMKSSTTTRACDVSTGTCVECVTDDQCTVDATKPICGSHVCGACKADTECPAPGIRLDDGSCAPEAHVVHLDASAATCPGNGSAATPFCSPADATAALVALKTILVVHGPNAAVTINSTLPSIVIVGKPNAAPEAAALSVGVGAGLTVSNGNVLARDLSAIAGASSSSKGFLVTGAGAKLTLLRVTSALGTGLGVDAEGGATLTMDRCIVQNDSVGGLLVNGAIAKVTNSVFANNGYGVKFNLPLSTTIFESNTVVGNSIAATCDSGHAQPLVGSIIVGFVDTCVPVDSAMAAPVFDTAKPFHLTMHDPCPMGDPANMMFPPDDIDGDPRTTGIDCGADQFVAK